MHASNFIYHDNEQELHGYLALDEKNGKRPAVLVVHDWSGRNAFACKKAELLAEMGYVGFAVDMYGQARVGETLDEKKGLMEPLMNDRRLLRQRIQAGLDAVLAMSEVDHERIAVVGFCFGGLCALDLARYGAQVTGVVSFHGLLNKPDGLQNQAIQSKILVLHGYDDPMAPPEQVVTFCEEMTEHKVDWQLHCYGNTKHAFTNPSANDEELGTIYNPIAERRSWLAMSNFLEEIFA